MDEKKTFFIVDDGRANNRGHIYHAGIKIAPVGWKVTLEPRKKSRDQECRYHAMIGDISKQCEFMNKKWSLETWKRLLVEAFVRAMRDDAKATGQPDPFADEEEGHIVPTLDGTGFVQLGVQTRKFKRKIASQFIEYLFAWGADNEVQWSDLSRHYLDEYFKSKR